MNDVKLYECEQGASVCNLLYIISSQDIYAYIGLRVLLREVKKTM